MASNISATITINDGFSGPLSKLSSGLQRSASVMDRFKSALNGGMSPKVPNQFNSGLNSMNGTLGKTGSMFKQFLGAQVIGAGITKGISMIGSGIGNMVSELNESSVAWQTFNGNMAMMGKTPAQIASARGDMQKFAQQTIYSASDMASTYSQLGAVGIKNTGNLVKGFGGLAAAATDPQQAMKTLSQQATQAAAKPKIQWQDFKLMLEQTPAGMAAVAKTMGMSTRSLVKNVQAGKIATNDFFNAIAKTGTNANFSKLATQYKTVGQAMDGLKETLANSLQPAFDKVSQVGIKAISGITDNIGKINFSALGDKLVPVIEGIINGVKTAGQAIGTFMKSLSGTGALSAVSSAFNSIGNAVKNVVSSLSSAGGNPFGMFDTLGKIAGGALKGAANAIKAISDVIGNLDPSSIKLLGAAFIALKAGAKGLVLTAIVAGLNALSKLNPGTLNALAKALGVLAIGLLTLKTLGKVDGILTGLSNSLSGFGKAGGLAAAGESAKTASVGFIKLGASLLMVGAAILMAGAGFYLIANAAIQLTTAGWPAIAMFFAMIAAIAILAVVVTVLGTAMIAGAVGFLIFGAAVLLIGAGVFVAAAGLAMLATQLPIIAAYGMQAALGLLVLGAAMAVFGILAIVAAAGLILLGVALVVLAVGFVIAGVGAIVLGVALMLIFVGAILAFAGLMMVFVGAMMAFVGLILVMTGAMMAFVGLMLVMVGGMMAMVGLMMVMIGGIMAMVGLMMVMIGGIMAMVGLMMVMVGGMMAMVGLMMVFAGAMVAFAGLVMVMTGALMAAAGMMVLAAATRMVASSVANIASSAASAAASLKGMVSAVSVVKSGLNSLKSAATSAVQGFISALRGGVGNARAAGSALAQAATSGMRSGVGAAHAAGSAIGAGLAAGLRSQVGAVEAAATALSNAAAKAARAAAKVHSPSRVFREIGGYMGAGLINGLDSMNSSVRSAASTMANEAIDAASLGGMNPGNILANGFNQATTAVYGLVGAMAGITDKTVAVNGQMNGTTSNTPASTPFSSAVSPYGTAGTTNTTNNNQSNGSSVVIADGAIQINSSGNADYDAETLVRKIELYLQNLDAGSMS